MMKTNSTAAGVVIAAGASVAMFALSGPALAWEPDKTVEFIVPAGSGGGRPRRLGRRGRALRAGRAHPGAPADVARRRGHDADLRHGPARGHPGDGGAGALGPAAAFPVRWNIARVPDPVSRSRVP